MSSKYRVLLIDSTNKYKTQIYKENPKILSYQPRYDNFFAVFWTTFHRKRAFFTPFFNGIFRETPINRAFWDVKIKVGLEYHTFRAGPPRGRVAVATPSRPRKCDPRPCPARVSVKNSFCIKNNLCKTCTFKKFYVPLQCN